MSGILRGRWSDDNREALEACLARQHRSAKIAVFDWDNTCIRGDVADSVFHQLALDLAFKFDAPGFWDWIGEVSLESRVRAAYDLYCGDQRAANRHHLRFRLEQLRARQIGIEDDTAAWAWDSGAFIGWSSHEVRSLAREVIERELERPIEQERLTLEGEEPIDIAWGLRTRTEMRDLVGVLRESGWEVWVISGTPQWVVEAFAEMYRVAPERVIGMQREIVDRKIALTVAPPVSYGDGKLGAYQARVSRSDPPLLVAGDSLGDWKLLESAEELRLLIEPIKTPLRDFALWRQSLGEQWFFQSFE